MLEIFEQAQLLVRGYQEIPFRTEGSFGEDDILKVQALDSFGFNGWDTGPGMIGPPYYQPPQQCRIIARHQWRGQPAHLWQCWNIYAHGPTSFRVDVIA